MHLSLFSTYIFWCEGQKKVWTNQTFLSIHSHMPANVHLSPIFEWCFIKSVASILLH